MKNKSITKILLKTILVLLIILTVLISLLGIHKKNLNQWDSLLPKYKLSKELSEIRSFGFEIDKSTEEVEVNDDENKEDSAEESSESEEKEEAEDASEETESSDEQEDSTEETKTKEVPVNDPKNLTEKNYKQSRDIIESRLKEFGITDTEVNLNPKTGFITVNAPNESVTDYIVTLVTNAGNVEFIDTETKEVLINNDMIKKATAYYQYADTDAEGNTYYNLGLTFTFTKKGQSKLNEMTKKYIETIDASGATTQKTIRIKINDEEKYETYFSPDGQYTEVSIPLYSQISVKDSKNFEEKYNECLAFQTEINSERQPLTYTVATSTFTKSNDNKKIVYYTTIGAAVILALVSVITIIKKKITGILEVVIELGYISLVLLLIRAADVHLTIAGLAMIAFVSVMNYLLINILSSEEKALEKLECFGKFILKIIPFTITIIVFAVSKEMNLQSVGMVGIWGILLFAYTLPTTIALINQNTKKNGVEE